MLRSPQEIINEIIEITKGKKYIFRGESRDYSKSGGRHLTSNLYRQFYLSSKNEPPIKNEYFSILKIEKNIISKAKKHLPYGASNIDILTQLQHYGGKTALIDFTYNLHIALFFACEKNLSEDGKLFMFPSEKFPEKNDIEVKKNNELIPIELIEQDILMMPTGKDPRIIFQSSVFVHAHKGYIEETAKLEIISSKEKDDILTYLRKNFNIHADTIYNDMYGFIKNLENHSTAEIEFYRGIAWNDQKNYVNAIKSYDEAIKINPQFTEAYNNRGNAKFSLGDTTGALLDYDKAIEINPQLAKPYNNRGNAKINSGDTTAALLDYDKAIRINPQNAEAYNNRGIAKINSGDTTGALLDYDKAIEINPQYADAYYNRGNAKINSGDTTATLLDYDKAIEINPQFAEAYYNRGIAKIKSGDTKSAEQDWLQAKKLAKEQNLNDDIEKINEALQQLENK
ncbi:MAG: tetratricopeptide repeat protein [Proteobacteria bacterium]|nr:tetratricopeptide repeat protein [Pseudomonadota bacterium]MCH9758155.1 tetratricopeptide repeat protein [Pseudomonadota bacterium]